MGRAERGLLRAGRRCLRVIEQAEPGFRLQDPAYGFVHARFRNAAFLKQLNQRLEKSRPVHVHVHASHYGLIDRLLLVGCHSMHRDQTFDVKPVADYEAGESTFFPQNVFNKPRVRMAWHAVEFVMRRHQGTGAGLEGSEIRRQEHAAKSVFGNIRGRTVETIHRLAAGDGVFDTGENAIRAKSIFTLQAAHGGRAQPANQKRILAIRLAGAPPTRVAGDIHIRRESPVRTVGPRFPRGLAGNPFDQGFIEAASQTERCRVNRGPMDQTISMDGIDADDERNLQPALRRQRL